jgi:peptide/nickel transport system substrate-binding protein
MGLLEASEMSSMPETRYAKRGESYIAYQVIGTGPFDLVQVPGYISHLDLQMEEALYANFFYRLASFCRLINFLKAAIGDPEFYKTCNSYFPCGTPLSTETGMEGLLKSDFRKAQELLREASYDGTPIVLLQSTDLQALTNLARVAKALMEKAGFNVDMQSVDWQTLVARRAKKDPPNSGGWHAFLTGWTAADISNPIFTGFFNSTCEKALFGWPCDPEMEKLRDQFARETDPAKQKAIAEEVQVRGMQMVSHIPLGQWYQRSLMRKNLVGMVQAPVPVFWNMELQ